MRHNSLSTYPQKEERKKVAKKERRKTTTTIFCQLFSGRHQASTDRRDGVSPFDPLSEQGTGSAQCEVDWCNLHATQGEGCKRHLHAEQSRGISFQTSVTAKQIRPNRKICRR